MYFSEMNEEQLISVINETIEKLYSLNARYFALNLCLISKYNYLIKLLENKNITKAPLLDKRKIKTYRLETILGVKFSFEKSIISEFYSWIESLTREKSKKEIKEMIKNGVFHEIKELLGFNDSEYDYALNLIGLQYVAEHMFWHHLSGKYTDRRSHIRYRPVARYNKAA